MTKFYSQCGEDKWIADNLPLPERGMFIDVGATDGIQSSNTLYFDEHLAWTGFLFEPDPRWRKSLYDSRGNFFNFILPAAVCSKSGIAGFGVSNSPGLSGFRCGSANRIWVRALRLDAMIDAARVPQIDLLSIDTEGTELDVFRSLGAHRPTIIIAEYNTEGLPSTEPELMEEITAAGYNAVYQTEFNLIFRLNAP